MITLDTTQKFGIELANVQDDGSPGQVDGPDQYLVDTPGIVTILPSPDGLSAEVRGNAQGTCTITPTDTANGVKIFGPGIDITVTAPPAKFATKIVESIGQVVPQ